MRTSGSTARLGYSAALGLLVWAGCTTPSESAPFAIVRLTASPDTVDLGSTAWVEVELQGSELDDPSFTWSASEGWIRGTGGTVNWDAPLEEGAHVITATVTLAGGEADSASVSITVRAGNNPLGHWITRTSMPTARQELATAVLAGKIYVVGGMNSAGEPLASVEVFDPSTNSWTSAAPLPEPRHHLGLAAAQGRLYATGGVALTFPSFNTTRDVYAYDPATDAWESRTPMPEGLRSHVSVEFGGKIYVIGGQRGSNAQATCQVYDPATNSWALLSPMPTARHHLAAAVLDALIYVVGGRALVNEEGTVSLMNFGTLEAYSPASDSWTSRPPMPTARSGLAAASLQGKLFALGGELPAIYRENEAYSPASNTWESLSSMPTPRHGITASILDGVIYVIGGGVVAAVAPSRVNEGFLP